MYDSLIPVQHFTMFNITESILCYMESLRGTVLNLEKLIIYIAFADMIFMILLSGSHWSFPYLFVSESYNIFYVILSSEGKNKDVLKIPFY
jgi:hypothetical protein